MLFIIRLYVFIRVGRMIAAYVSFNPSVFETSRYVGISPPEKNIVKVMSIIKRRLNKRSFRERTYAPKEVNVIFNATPQTTINSVFANPLRIIGFLSISLYAFVENPNGCRRTPVCPISRELSLKEPTTTCHIG